MERTFRIFKISWPEDRGENFIRESDITYGLEEYRGAMNVKKIVEVEDLTEQVVRIVEGRVYR